MKETLVYWLERYQRPFFYCLLAIGVGIFAGLRFGGAKKGAATGGATVVFQNWERAESADGPEMDELMRLIEKYPSVSGAYGVRVVEGLLARGAAEKAGEFARGVLERTASHTPEFSLFARGSLLIARGALQEALEEAALLKTALAERNKGESILYGYALLRMVTLCNALGLDEGEAKGELSLFLKNKSAASAALQTIFSAEGFSLEDFLRRRPSRMHDQAHSPM
ncbi:MAG: hypothetical protein K940chlam2_00278 [Chlamydiae bacterium]|nr:hypothetical protein [Chlamydiota bacterium]